MLVPSFDTFYEQAEALFRAEPLRTRFVTKYRHSDGKLELKVTDDKLCLQFRTDQAQDLKRLEKLNQLFFALTVHGETAELAHHMPPDAPAAAGGAPSRAGGGGAGKKQRGNRQ